MNSISFKRRFIVAILGVSTIVGTGTLSSVTSSAQGRGDSVYVQDQDRDRDDNNRRGRRGRNWDRYGRWGGSYELRQTALNAGYNEGSKEGRKDRSKGRRFNFYDQKEYQKATKDYSSKLGDKELYRRYFRDGFENGYTDGYRGY